METQAVEQAAAAPDINMLFVVLAALVPMIIGALFYGPLFGKQWMDSLGFTEDNMPQPIKMPFVFGISLILSFLLAYSLAVTIEITHKDVNDAGELIFGSHHTFGHGAFHGLFIGLFMIIPVLVSNLLFQRNSGKNILLNLVYWTLTVSIMGGIVDGFK